MNKNAHLSRAILVEIIGAIGMTLFVMMGNMLEVKMSLTSCSKNDF